MAELTATSLIHATVLAEYLVASRSGSAPVLVPYLGALTPQQLDAIEAETGALLSGAAVHDLGWLRRVAVLGEDRFRWLSGMVTNAVDTLPDSHGAYNLVLNAQGRIQGDCYVWRNGDRLELEVTAEQSEALLAHLDHFIIMDDVELKPLTSQSALGIIGPKAEAILNQLGLSAPADELSSTAGSVERISVRLNRGYGTIVPHFALWAAQEDIPALWQVLVSAGASPAGAASLETLRIAEGIPAYGVDIQARDLPQETSQLRAISFTKGCYLGQEIVERIRSRGQVHRHLRALELIQELTQGSLAEPPTVGAELHISGNGPETKPAGTLTSIAAVQRSGARRIFAIGMIRAEAEVGDRQLTYSVSNSGGTAQILHSPPKLTLA